MASTITRRAPVYFTKSGGVDRRFFDEVRRFIETRADAERNRARNLRALISANGLPQLAWRILGCEHGALCEDPLCSRSARVYRTWFGGQVLNFLVEPVEAHIVTLLLVAVGGAQLHKVDVRAEHDRLRKRLIRSGVRSAIGGTEAAYDAPNDRWVVHVHLLVFGEIEQAITRLRVMAKRDGLERPVKCQRVCDPVNQVTYLQKFVTYYRPGKASAGGKGRPYPLKPRHVAELARWFAPRRFGDFAFLLGFRRRGSRIVAEPSFDEIVAETSRRMATWRRGDARKTATARGAHFAMKSSISVLPVSSTKAATRMPNVVRIAKTGRPQRPERRPSTPSGPRRHARRQL
ncbi:MAG TPA: hypothetical protein VKG91_08010 [Roseiarcus sp.]|nr:hypothetical protein [Roseiarcus sp.]